MQARLQVPGERYPCGGALTAVGKLASAPNSHAALVDEWTSALARAKRGVAELAADCIESIAKLMDGAWASAESMGVASLKGSMSMTALPPPAGSFGCYLSKHESWCTCPIRDWRNQMAACTREQ